MGTVSEYDFELLVALGPGFRADSRDCTHGHGRWTSTIKQQVIVDNSTPHVLKKRKTKE